jgi:ankyrin repeat protein
VTTSPDVARILIDSGASVDEQNNVLAPPDHFLSLTFSKDGNTPLHLACQNCSTGMIRILLRHSLDPFIENQVRVPSFPLLHMRSHRDQRHQMALEVVDLETPVILELFFHEATTRKLLARVRQTHRHPSLHSV